jgi:hypothetical protein
MLLLYDIGIQYDKAVFVICNDDIKSLLSSLLSRYYHHIIRVRIFIIFYHLYMIASRVYFKPFVNCTSAHIYSAVLDAEGRAWAWGCGSKARTTAAPESKGLLSLSGPRAAAAPGDRRRRCCFVIFRNNKKNNQNNRTSNKHNFVAAAGHGIRLAACVFNPRPHLH